MFITKSKKDDALHRLKIIRGHIEKIITMVEQDAYCIDVLTQTKAVQNALKRTDEVLLENHMSCCVVDHIKNGRGKQATDEIMKVFAQR